MTHTPEWQLDAGRCIVTPQGTFHLSYGKDRYGNPTWQDSFAALDKIAQQVSALPELLAACKLSLRNVESLIHFFPVNGEPNEKRSLETWADMLRSAIAKAEGR